MLKQGFDLFQAPTAENMSAAVAYLHADIAHPGSFVVETAVLRSFGRYTLKPGTYPGLAVLRGLLVSLTSVYSLSGYMVLLLEENWTFTTNHSVPAFEKGTKHQPCFHYFSICILI